MEEFKNESTKTEILPAENEGASEAVVAENSSLAEAIMHERDMQKVTAKQRVVKFFVQFGLYLFLGIMALIVIFPFYWMIISSLKTLPEYELLKPTFFPQEIHWQNYENAFVDANMGRLFLNTLFVGVVSTLLSLVITILAAFAFARLEF